MSEAELATLGTMNTTTSASSSAIEPYSDREHVDELDEIDEIDEIVEIGETDGIDENDENDENDGTEIPSDSDLSNVVVSDLEGSSLGRQSIEAFVPGLALGTAAASVRQAAEHAHAETPGSSGSAAHAGGPGPEVDALSPLDAACQAGDLQRAEQLLSPSTLNSGGLHHAAGNNHWRLVQLLLARGADVDRRLAPLDATPLMWATRNGHAYIVKLLLEHGADVGVADASGFTPLHLAVQSSNVLMVAYIAHLEVDMNAGDGGRRAPLHWAIVQNDHLTVEVLLKAGASPNLPDGEGLAPLYLALYMAKSADIVTLLLQYGADPLAATPDGTPVVDAANPPPQWVQACANCGRLATGLPRRSRVLSPELAKGVSSVAPLLVLVLALSATRLLGTAWLGVPLSGAVVWAAKRALERWVVPVCWPHPKPMLHSTVLAGTFAGVFVLIIAFYMSQMARIMFALHPAESAAVYLAMALIPFFFITTLTMDPGVINPKSTAVRLRSMNDLMDDGLFDSVHFCIHTYVVIPARAVYDYYLERVVCRYDHYCPWVYNAVGIRNHRAFIAFVVSTTIGAPLYVKQYIEFSSLYGFGSFGVGLALLTTVQVLWVGILGLIQLGQTARGTTSYEVTHFKKSLIYKTDPVRAFSSLPADHPKAPDVLDGYRPSGSSATTGPPHSPRPNDISEHSHSHSHSHSHGHHDGHSHGHSHSHSPGGHHGGHHGGSRFLLCLKLFGLHQLMAAYRVLLHKSAWNEADNGIPRNCADFWCAGGPIWRPDGAQGAIGGVVVNYYTLRDLPAGGRYRETDQMLV